MDRPVRVSHDKRVTSHSIDQGLGRHIRKVDKGLLDLELAYQWLRGLLETKGDSLYRMKGVLAIAHAEQKYVYHAVHASFEGGFAEPWGAEEQRDSKLVFIGKDLGATKPAWVATPSAPTVAHAGLARVNHAWNHA